MVGVGVQQHAQASHLGGSSAGTQHSHVRRHSGLLHVAHQLLVHLGLLVGQDGLHACLVHLLGTARNLHRVGEDLAVVADAVGWSLGRCGGVVAVNRGVVRVGGAQTVTAPLVQRLHGLATASAGDDRGLLGVFAGDEVGQVFTNVVAGRVAGIGIGWDCHLQTSLQIVLCDESGQVVTRPTTTAKPLYAPFFCRLVAGH